ncbi:hypothetical protein [Priestia megaterium]|uniref:hypothetical protein n=1 Tax=Priestia megaterium TaxID=1404 RepID=UPI000BFDC6FC|nr:hypothetical protein [Priestia megaterium]PGT73597.1 hypothetical protein COD15_10340 [Priestia megaterium]
MISFSIFQFYSYESLNDFQVTLRDNQKVERAVRDWESDSLISEVRGIQDFSIHTQESIQIENQHIPYIFFEGYTERQKRPEYWYNPNGSMKDKVDRVNPYQVNILVFQFDSKVYSIVFSGINRAKAIVKDIFTVETWGNINPVAFNINEDLLYWIFKRFIDTPRESLSDEKQVYITSLESYMGKTRDNINAMRGEGSRISTILGTLAFLFNNEELKAIRPSIQYGNEKVLVEIGLTGTFKTWPQAYRGQYFRTLTGQRKENAVAIYIFQWIIPLLIECYDENYRNNKWSPQLKVDFLKRLGTMIRDEVDNVLLRIERESLQQHEVDDLETLEADDFDLEIGDEDGEEF